MNFHDVAAKIQDLTNEVRVAFEAKQLPAQGISMEEARQAIRLEDADGYLHLEATDHYRFVIRLHGEYTFGTDLDSMLIKALAQAKASALPLADGELTAQTVQAAVDKITAPAF